MSCAPWSACVERPGKQLFAGTGLAEQQHAAVGLHDFFQGGERRAQRGALADDLGESM